jgi:hypothetical protein
VAALGPGQREAHRRGRAGPVRDGALTAGGTGEKLRLHAAAAARVQGLT